jgi:hypothetical protein
MSDYVKAREAREISRQWGNRVVYLHQACINLRRTMVSLDKALENIEESSTGVHYTDRRDVNSAKISLQLAIDSIEVQLGLARTGLEDADVRLGECETPLRIYRALKDLTAEYYVEIDNKTVSHGGLSEVPPDWYELRVFANQTSKQFADGRRPRQLAYMNRCEDGIKYEWEGNHRGSFDKILRLLGEARVVSQ